MAVRRPDGTWLVSKTANGDWHPEEIKSAVRMQKDDDGQGWSLDRLASESGLPPHACRSSIRVSNAAGEAVIAQLLGLMPGDIWPSRYRKDGTRIHPARGDKANVNAIPRARHCEKRGAA